MKLVLPSTVLPNRLMWWFVQYVVGALGMREQGSVCVLWGVPSLLPVNHFRVCSSVTCYTTLIVMGYLSESVPVCLNSISGHT